MKKLMAVLVALIMCCASFTACGNKKEQTDAISTEIKQNDYRGGVTRTEALQTAVLDVMDKMKSNNETIRESSPNSFWSTDGYQDFVVNFLNSQVIKDTEALNEEENEWAEVVALLGRNETRLTEENGNGDGYSLNDDITVTRNEKDDYSITGVPIDITAENTKYEGIGNYRVLYDCDKDWCKAYITYNISESVPDITADMYEYARIDANTFAVQTSKERLLVKLKPAKKDIDLRKREIKEFYYSKLTNDSKRTTYKDFQSVDAYDDYGNYDEEVMTYNEVMESYGFVNENGDICTQYGKNDSMFLTDNMLDNITSDWVFEDKSLQQAIVYKKGALVVTTYNKLSENYERFIYAKSDVSDADISVLEKMVEIENLVGVQSISGVDEDKKAEETEDMTSDMDSTVDSAVDSITDSSSLYSGEAYADYSSSPSTDYSVSSSSSASYSSSSTTSNSYSNSSSSTVSR